MITNKTDNKDFSKLDVIDLTGVNQELIRFNTNYYRDKYRHLAKLLIFLIFTNTCLLSVVCYLYITEPKVPQDFYTSSIYNGNVAPMYPLDKPLLKPEKLIEWTEQTIVASFSYNFVNYRDSLDNIRNLFTLTGWDDFNNALQSTGILGKVSSERLFLSATLDGASKILSDGIIEGHYAWKLRIPLLISFKANETTIQTQKHIIVEIIVTRIPNLDNPEQIAISNFSVIAQPLPSGSP